MSFDTGWFEEKKQKLIENIDKVDSSLTQLQHEIASQRHILASVSNEATEATAKTNIDILLHQELDLSTEKVEFQMKLAELSIEKVVTEINHDKARLHLLDAVLLERAKRNLDRLGIEKERLLFEKERLLFEKNKLLFEKERLLFKKIKIDLEKEKMRLEKDKRTVDTIGKWCILHEHVVGVLNGAIPHAESLNCYLGVAQETKSLDQPCQILSRIKKIANSKQKEIPFIFLGGSSGVGKTQMALTLAHMIHSEPALKCFYLLFELDQRAQNIYQNFQNVSSLLLDALEKDLRSIGSKIDCAPSNLLEHKLYLFAVIHTLAKYYPQEDMFARPGATINMDSMTVTISTMAGREVKDYLSKQDFTLVIFVDEVTASDPVKVRLLRNVIRSLGIVLVFLGTDSKASTLIKASTYSTDNPSNDEWCHLYIIQTELTVKTSCLAAGIDSMMTDPWYKNVIEKSRPRFAVFFLKQMHTLSGLGIAESLDNALCAVFDQIWKSMERKNEFESGQVMLFFQETYMSSFETADVCKKLSNTVQLVDSHFARLCAASKEYHILITTSAPKLFGVFEYLQKDVLLYLTMMGVKERSPFRESSFTQICLIQNVFQTHKWQNSDAVKNDGNSLEASASACLIAASRWGGVAGVPLCEYIFRLVKYLAPSYCCIPEEVKKIFCGMPMANRIVPFLSPDHQPWPKWLSKLEGCNFGDSSRPADSTRNDFFGVACTESAINISAECKDWDGSIGQAIANQIIKNVKYGSVVHFVFCTRGGISKNVRSPKNCNCWKVIIEDRTVSAHVLTASQDSIPIPKTLEAVIFVHLAGKLPWDAIEVVPPKRKSDDMN